MYFAVAELRSPPFELWGLLTKALQVVLLAAVVYLAIRCAGQRAASTRSLTPA
jgi:hypothetical protein